MINKIKLINLTSKSLTENTFPMKYVCSRQGGKDLVPKLKWNNIEGVKSYALILDDPDAPYHGGYVHWIVQYIPPNINQLPIMKPSLIREFKISNYISNSNNNNKNSNNKNSNNTLNNSNKIIQGINSFGRYSYGGPCPPPDGKYHRYYFRLYALDTVLTRGNKKNEFVTRNKLIDMMKNHIIGYGELMKTFKNINE
jgi:Raf kinase inhibitor-like YbhB/YbcL family protein